MTRYRLRWAAVLLLVVGGMVLLISTAAQWAARREAASQADAIRRSIEVYALSLRGAAAKYNYLPFAASQHPAVVAALEAPAGVAGESPGNRHQRANLYLEDMNRRAGADALYVMTTTGMTLAASNWNTPQSFVAQNYSNRPYFLEARDGGSGQFYGIGTTTGIPGLFIATPVRRNGIVIGVVAVKVSLREIEATWAMARDPVMLADARGIFFIGSIAPWKFSSRRQLSAGDLQEIRKSQQYGRHVAFPPIDWKVEPGQGAGGYLVQAKPDGQTRKYLAVDESLPDLGWTLTVMTDHAPVARARDAVWIIGALGASLLLLGGLYARLRLRRHADQARTRLEHEQRQQQRLVEQSEARQELEVRVRERTADLQEAGAFRKAMEDSLLVGMRARDLDGRIRYVNPALCEMTGYRADQLIDRLPPYPYWHPDDLDKHWEESNAALEGKAALTGFESRIRHRDGHDVHTMVYTAPLIDGEGRHKGWMSSVVDLTQQKLAQAQQDQQDRKLQHAGRLANLGEMASILAHELNQPLMALVGFASVAKTYARQNNQSMLDRSLDDVQAEVARAAEIVRRIRGFVSLRTAGMEPCDMGAIVREVLALLKPEISGQAVRVTTRLEAPMPMFHGDRVLLQQVLLNLVTNGIQAMRNTPAGQRLLEIDVRADPQGLRVTVADRGPGIGPEVAAHLFEPYFTTKPDGLGLGLNICRTIIESHRGSLAFESRADGGAVFSIYLALPL